jgi:hypothetical protein
MLAILRPREVPMRPGFWRLAVCTLIAAANSGAQVAPSHAYPIKTASPKPPVMQFDSKDRTAEVDVLIGPDGRAISTTLVTRSGSGIYDERVRGFWRAQPFVPAIDADGKPVESTLRTRAIYSVRLPPERSAGIAYRTNGFRFRMEIADEKPGDTAARIERMRCRDVTWEYDFMRGVAPKANLRHEEIFHIAFAMLIAARHLSTESRDALIAQWDALVDQTLDSCRAQPAARYWKDAFAPTFDSAAPVGVNVQ